MGGRIPTMTLIHDRTPFPEKASNSFSYRLLQIMDFFAFNLDFGQQAVHICSFQHV